MPADQTRRALLRRGVALAGLGGLGATAGCLGLRAFGRERPALRDEIRRWAPAPGSLSALGVDLDEQYSLQARNLDALRSAPGRVRELLSGSPPERYEPLGLSPEDVRETVVLGQRTTVNRVEYDADALAGRLRDLGFERRGDAGEFRLFRGALPVVGSNDREVTFPVLFGTDGSHLLEVPTNQGRWSPAESTIRAIAAAGTGEGSRYADANDAVEMLLGNLDSSLFVLVSPIDPVDAETASPEYGRFEGTIGRGVGTEASDRRLRAVEAFVFDERSNVPGESALETYREEGRFGGDRLSLEHRRTTIEGRVVKVVYETDVADLTPAV